MEFDYAYARDSQVRSDSRSTSMSFAPDTTREPTFFSGRIGNKLAFREAISALHDVVVSDLRWHPKDRTAYMRWRAQQDELDWVEVAAQQRDVAKQLEQVREELNQLRARRETMRQPYLQAQQRYFKYLYQRDYNAWFVLDPVVSVHPDELFFECFSRDESSYGRLAVGYNVFEHVGELACGTTNVDYSTALYDEFQKIRSYKETQLEVDPSGFAVATTDQAAHKEVKIDLPDSWVRGFLQVSSAMALQAATLELHPMDIHNMCRVLRRNRELVGPRAMRYVLRPDRPVQIVFEPWETTVDCPRSKYLGEKELEVRVWGRRRLHILERLIPVTDKFTVHLLGKGMPSFYVAHLGDMTFTLGLSGWTANDWSRSGNFDLLAPRAEVDEGTRRRVFTALRETWQETPQSLARRLDLDRATVLGALAAYTQAGRAIWDFNRQVYRIRELSREPLHAEQLRFASPREQTANELVAGRAVQINQQFVDSEGSLHLDGVVRGKQNSEPALRIDRDDRIAWAECSCNFYRQNRLRLGPCECILALRTQYTRQSASSFLELW